jgi:hypothetical protein
MPQKICKHCGKTYIVENEQTDDCYCSYECWEKDNCCEPEEVSAEAA